MNPIDLYLEGMFSDNMTEYEFVNEGKIFDKLRSIMSKFSSVKKPSGDEKKQGEEFLKAKESDPKYKKIHKVVAKHFEETKRSRKVNKSKLKKDLADVTEYGVAQLLVAAYSGILSVVLIYGKSITYAVPISFVATVIFALSNMPAPIITKLITRTDKTSQEINQQIAAEMGDKGEALEILAIILSFFSTILFTIPASTSIGALGVWAGAIVVILALVKMIWGIVIGIKKNNWKTYEKTLTQGKKTLVGESIEYTLQEHVDSLVFIASLRESIMNMVKDDNHKAFILDEATDYEILYYTVEGTFPENREGNSDILMSMISESIDHDFIIPDVSSIGVLGSILSETINQDILKSESSLLTEEIKVNAAKLEKLQKLKKDARKAMFKSHPDHTPGYADMTDAQKAKVNARSEEAAEKLKAAGERYDTYKATGKDPGPGPRKKPGGAGAGGAGSSGGSWWTNQDSTWWKDIAKKMSYPKNLFRDLFSSVKGASELGAKMNVNPALAGGFIVLSGVAAAALLITLSYKTYSRLASKAARACKGKSFKVKSACMLTFEIKATNDRIVDLRKAEKLCTKIRKHADQTSCSQALNGRIKVLRSNIKDMESELSNLKKAA